MLLQSSGVDVNVISHSKQRYAVWYGGSMMASLVSFFVPSDVAYLPKLIFINVPTARVLYLLPHQGPFRSCSPFG
jgi:carbon starvation protein CstA